MGRIDERTVVPLSWVIPGFLVVLSAAVGAAVTGTFWVSSVNTRLARIEKHLGIQPDEVAESGGVPDLFKSAVASQGKR